jgi:hypothetical protein
MYLQLLVELIHNLNKCFCHYEILVAIDTLSHYLFNCEVVLCSYGLKIILFILDLSLTPLQLLHEFQTSLLLIKYYNKTNVALNTSNSGVHYYLQYFKDFSPLITQQSFLKLWLPAFC